MLLWRKFWSLLDCTILRLFEKDDAALLRTIAEQLPDDNRDVVARR